MPNADQESRPLPAEARMPRPELRQAKVVERVVELAPLPQLGRKRAVADERSATVPARPHRRRTHPVDLAVPRQRLDQREERQQCGVTRQHQAKSPQCGMAPSQSEDGLKKHPGRDQPGGGADGFVAIRAQGRRRGRHRSGVVAKDLGGGRWGERRSRLCGRRGTVISRDDLARNAFLRLHWIRSSGGDIVRQAIGIGC